MSDGIPCRLYDWKRRKELLRREYLQIQKDCPHDNQVLHVYMSYGSPYKYVRVCQDCERRAETSSVTPEEELHGVYHQDGGY